MMFLLEDFFFFLFFSFFVSVFGASTIVSKTLSVLFWVSRSTLLSTVRSTALAALSPSLSKNWALHMLQMLRNKIVKTVFIIIVFRGSYFLKVTSFITLLLSKIGRA